MTPSNHCHPNSLKNLSKTGAPKEGAVKGGKKSSSKGIPQKTHVKFTDARRDEVLAHIENGMAVKAACHAVGVSPGSYYTRLGSDPEMQKIHEEAKERGLRAYQDGVSHLRETLLEATQRGVDEIISDSEIDADKLSKLGANLPRLEGRAEMQIAASIQVNVPVNNDETDAILASATGKDAPPLKEITLDDDSEKEEKIEESS